LSWRWRTCEHELSLSLEDLRTKFESGVTRRSEPVLGNSRSFFAPRVSRRTVGQWRLGNAKWTGVRLKGSARQGGAESGGGRRDVQGARQVARTVGAGLRQVITVDKANDPDILVAYAMNDKPLPMLNGFPLGLSFQAGFATYWVKALNEIRVTRRALHRLLDGQGLSHPRQAATAGRNPGSARHRHGAYQPMLVRSLIVRPEPREAVKAGQACELDGIAFDGGSGIKQVDVSTDGGKSWSKAVLGQDLGKFSFRRWKHDWTPWRASTRSWFAPSAITARPNPTNPSGTAAGTHGTSSNRCASPRREGSLSALAQPPRQAEPCVHSILVTSMQRILLPIIVLAVVNILAVPRGPLPASAAEPSKADDEEKSIQLPVIAAELPEGKGLATVNATCTMCHSTRYISMQPNFPRKTWAATVDKMRKTFGAPLSDQQASEVVDYLVAVRGSPEVQGK
jgi:DMSO/TMAO reductase YedYZ molybdopterin-dependent catalytic subunit/cytochrome c5